MINATHLPRLNTPEIELKVLPKQDRVFLSEWTDEDITELQHGMIKSAIEDIRDGRKSKKMQQEARKWMLCTDLDYPFSFVNCCSALGFDETVLRNLVNRLTQGGLLL